MSSGALPPSSAAQPTSSSSTTSPGELLKQELLLQQGGPYSPAIPISISWIIPDVLNHSTPATPPRDISITAQVIASQPFGCALEEIELQANHLTNASMDVLKKWANALCQKVTYLLESLGPLEFDQDGQEVLIRSIPPSSLTSAKRYYEIRLTTLGQGRFVLGRYEAVPGQSRSRQPLELGIEQIVRLGNDLVATLPESA